MMDLSLEREKRLAQERAVFRMLEQNNEASFDDLYKDTDLTKLKLTAILNELVRENRILFKDGIYSINLEYEKTLCICLLRDTKRMHLVYRVYKSNDEMELERDIIKLKLSLTDISDVIDFVLATVKGVRKIGISLPGIIENGNVISTGIEGFDNINFNVLTSKYEQEIFIENDVNTSAVGFAMSRMIYENVAFLFQPATSTAGCGLVVNGKLLRGKTQIAGEVQYLPINFSKDPKNMHSTPSDVEELVGKYLETIIAMINPEAIAIYCTMLVDVENIKKYLKTVFRKANDLPELILIKDMVDYQLLGLNVLGKDY